MTTEPTRNTSRVHVIDDEADYRHLVEQVFARFLPQYAITLFPGGDALLQHLQTNSAQPNLILLDLLMPGMSSQQTLTRLKQESA